MNDLHAIPKRIPLGAGDIVPVTYGGTGANLSATGPGFLIQVGVGSNITVVNLEMPDLFGFNGLEGDTRDPFEIRSNYGLTVSRNGDIYFIDSQVLTSDLPTVSGGQGITVAITGTDYRVHQREPRVVLTDGATVTMDCTNDNNFRLNMGASPGSRTLAVSSVSVGQKFSILLKQGGSNTVTWFSGILWPGGVVPTLTSTADHGDLYAFECLASGVYLGFTVNQNFDLTGV